MTAEGSFAPTSRSATGASRRSGPTLRPHDGVETVDVTGRLLMPGFIDAHTHMDMPFGGTITADDWDTGTAAAVAGRHDDDRRLRAPGHRRTALARRDRRPGRPRPTGGRTSTTACTSRSATSPRPSRPRSPTLPDARRLHRQGLHGLQGHAALHGRTRTCSRSCRSRATSGVLVMVHAENGDVDRQAPGAGARARRHRPDLPRAHPPRGGGGRGDRPRDPAGRDRRRAVLASST